MNYLIVSLSERMPFIIIFTLGILLMIYLEYRIFKVASKRGNFKFEDVVFGILLLIAIIVGIIVLLASNGLLS